MMRTYEYPLGVQFRASTGEHAAARVFGGNAADYLAVPNTSARDGSQWMEVSDEYGNYVGDIPIV